MDVVHNPPNKFRISEVWMFVSLDNQGNEGVCGVTVDGMMMPLIAADKDRLDSLRQYAQQLADIGSATGKVVRLIKMSTREEVEVIRSSTMN